MPFTTSAATLGPGTACVVCGVATVRTRSGVRRTCSDECLRKRCVGRPSNTPDCFWNLVDKTGDCWIWKGTILKSSGYGQLSYGHQKWLPHRLAWSLTNGPIPSGLLVCHHCDVRACVRPDHLFLGTHQENMADCGRKGRRACGNRNGSRLYPERLVHQNGERNGMSKLSTDDVREVRRLAASGLYQREIGPRFGVSPTTIGKILRGERWSSVT